MRISYWRSDVCASDLRTYDRRHLLRLGSLDLAGTVREVFETAICMGTKAIKILGVSAGEIVEIERRFRENDKQRLDVQGAEGSRGAAKDLIYRVGLGERRSVVEGRSVSVRVNLEGGNIIKKIN